VRDEESVTKRRVDHYNCTVDPWIVPRYGTSTLLATRFVCLAGGRVAKREVVGSLTGRVEALAGIDTVAFDKRGTLTFGTPRLVESHPLNGLAETDVLRLAAIAEKYSEHPLGQSLVRAAQERGLLVADPEDFETLPGLGVRTRTDGREIVLGRGHLLAERGVPVSPDLRTQLTTLATAGRTAIPVAVNAEVAGLLVLEDALRPEAGATVACLHHLGLRTVLVSGDNPTTAERIAAELGIGEVHAEVLPQQKVEIVKRLQAAGHRVAFVGDGVNDGPALATADVGVAMGRGGTDVAIETAEIALLSDDLTRLPHLLDLARRAIRAIKQNLVFSLGVLTVAVGLAIPGILTPVTGALLHELSSIPVIMNSARLIGFKEHDD
jgi:Zn2+/Cd2+-exporting ATPase